MKKGTSFSKFEKTLLNLAKSKKKTIVLPEAEEDDRVLEAGMYLVKHSICNVVFLSKNNKFLSKYLAGNGYYTINYLHDDRNQMLANALYEKRMSKGMTIPQAKELLKNKTYYATMLVETGLCDGMVCGATTSTADTLRPALQIIKGKKSDSIISSYFVLISKDKTFGEKGVMLLSDCALNQNPTSKQLATITKDTVLSAYQLGIKNARVALLSYSTLGSAQGDNPTKMQEVKKLLNGQSFIVDGEYQMDAATRKEVAALKATKGRIQGDANILIFPNLESGNIAYKAMCRVGDIKAIGPITQGLRLPVNDLSRGATVQEIILTVALTCLQS